MRKYQVIDCPACGQRLRVPTKIGGMLMQCPSCGEKLRTDFRISSSPRGKRQILVELFHMPSTLWDRFFNLWKK